MNSESINYVRDLLKKAYYSGAWDMSQELVLTDNITYELAQRLREAMKAEAARHAKEITIDEKALRCANSERAEGEVTANLHAVPTTLDTSWGAWEDICLRMLECCHTVCILPLPGWKESVGVRAELEHARVLGMRISFVSFLAEGRIDFMDATEWRRQ